MTMSEYDEGSFFNFETNSKNCKMNSKDNIETLPTVTFFYLSSVTRHGSEPITTEKILINPRIGISPFLELKRK